MGVHALLVDHPHAIPAFLTRYFEEKLVDHLLTGSVSQLFLGPESEESRCLFLVQKTVAIFVVGLEYLLNVVPESFILSRF